MNFDFLPISKIGYEQKNLLFLILDPYFILGLKSPVSLLRSGLISPVRHLGYFSYTYKQYKKTRFPKDFFILILKKYKRLQFIENFIFFIYLRCFFIIHDTQKSSFFFIDT